MAVDIEKLSDEEFDSLVDSVMSGGDITEEVADKIDDEKGDDIVEDTIDTHTDDKEETSVEDTDTESDEDSDEDNAQQDDDTTDDEADGDDNTDEVEPEDQEADDDSSDDKEPNKELEIPEEYKKAKEFYESLVNAEFKANGVLVKGTDDPKKWIQGQQALAGLEEKFKGFKKYRDYMKAMDKYGLIGQDDKFNKLMELAQEDQLLTDDEQYNLIRGLLKKDKNAIKAYISKVGLDPVELLDEEEDGKIDIPQYDVHNHLPDSKDVVIEEIFDTADRLGVGDKLYDELKGRWDGESTEVLMSNKAVQSDIISHLQDGTYDMVLQKIAQKEVYDYAGTFKNKPFIQKYDEIYSDILREYASKENTQQKQQVNEEKTVDTIVADKKQQEEYKKKVQQKEQQIDEQRQKASQISRTKKRTAKKQEFDPVKLSDEEFEKFMHQVMGEPI